MRKFFITTDRFHYLLFYFVLFSFFFLFAGLECKNTDPDNISLEAYFTIKPETGYIKTVFSFDPDGCITHDRYPIQKYQWDFEGDGNIDVTTSTYSTVNHQYSNEGVYNVKLTVENETQSDFYTKELVVEGSCIPDFFYPCPDQPNIIHEGQKYKTVQIGDQCWFAENLNFGEMIKTYEAEQSDNGKVEKYCYNNQPDNCQKYGGMYTWFEMMDYKDTPGAQGICPVGWHIPTQADWDQLANTIGGYATAGIKMMSCEDDAWAIERATNESGFTAYPGGRFWGGSFDWIEWRSIFWTSEFSTEYNNSESAFYRELSREDDNLIGFGTGQDGKPWLWDKWSGGYVRCVKD